MSCAVLTCTATAAAVAVGVAAVRPATPAHPTVATVPAAVQIVRFAPSSTLTVHWRGNGHGHGMSQYGAYGAALKGLRTAQILSFYYPGTSLVRVAASRIRVRLTNTATAHTTVLAGTRGLTLSGYGALPTTGYRQFRLVPSGSGLLLQGRTPAGRWVPLRTGLPARADFSSALGWVQSLNSDGSSIRYRGTVGAVRSGPNEITVNRLALDQYVEGSAPREMPASWDAAAVHAQAIASRSYAETMRSYAGSGSGYDICDTTSCQAYGGMAGYAADGTLQYTDDPAAIAGNENTVLRYRGAPVFAQYSASNGGATVDGGQPYLVGRSDPYDTSASGDPYLDESDTAPATAVAAAYGLKAVSSVEITRRDGNGPWGGRVVTAYVDGTTWSGGAAHVATDGFGLGSALGVYTDYLQLAVPSTTPSVPRTLTWTAGNAAAQVRWTPPASTGGSVITGYRVGFGNHTIDVPAGTRSAWVAPLSNVSATRVWVVARNAQGAGSAASVQARGVAAPAPVTALDPLRIVDTTATGTVIDPSHPYRVAVAGHHGIPAAARSVQVTVSVFRATAKGVLTLTSAGVQPRRLAAVAYRAGLDATATVSVPLVPSGTVVVTPSRGRVQLTVDRLSYAASPGSALRVVAPVTVARIRHVPKAQGIAVDLSRVSSVGKAATGVLLDVFGSSRAPSALRIWADGRAAPRVRQVSVGPNSSSSNAVIVPLAANHRLRISSTYGGGPGARVVLLGVLTTTGGRLESIPPSPVADDMGAPRGRTVGTARVTVPVTGVNQVPASGVSAVLLHVTARGQGTAGTLWTMTGDGTAASRAAASPMHVPATGTVSATAFVRVVRAGKVALVSSVPGVRVAVDAIGYVAAAG